MLEIPLRLLFLKTYLPEIYQNKPANFISQLSVPPIISEVDRQLGSEI